MQCHSLCYTCAIPCTSILLFAFLPYHALHQQDAGEKTGYDGKEDDDENYEKKTGSEGKQDDENDGEKTGSDDKEDDREKTSSDGKGNDSDKTGSLRTVYNINNDSETVACPCTFMHSLIYSYSKIQSPKPF